MLCSPANGSGAPAGSSSVKNIRGSDTETWTNGIVTDQGVSSAVPASVVNLSTVQTTGVFAATPATTPAPLGGTPTPAGGTPSSGYFWQWDFSAFGSGYVNNLNPWSANAQPPVDGFDRYLAGSQKTAIVTAGVAGAAAGGLAVGVAVGVPGASGLAGANLGAIGTGAANSAISAAFANPAAVQAGTTAVGTGIFAYLDGASAADAATQGVLSAGGDLMPGILGGGAKAFKFFRGGGGGGGFGRPKDLRIIQVGTTGGTTNPVLQGTMGDGCFVAGTLVHISALPDQLRYDAFENYGVEERFSPATTTAASLSVAIGGNGIVIDAPSTIAMAIEAVPVGSRVTTRNPRRSDYDFSFPESDGDHWIRLSLEVRRLDGSVVDVELLRPDQWVGARELSVGMLLPMMSHELDVKGMARIVAIDNSPTLASGEGELVIGRFVTRQVGKTIRMTFSNGETLEGTPIHPVWSPDDNDWRPMSNFAVGDIVLGRDGMVSIESLEFHCDPVSVYNLEVRGEHVYEVTAAGVLVHNSNECLVTQISMNGKPLVNYNATKAPSSIRFEGFKSFADSVGEINSLTGIKMIGKTKSPGIASQGFIEKWIGKGSDGQWYSAFRNPKTGEWSFGGSSSHIE